MIRKPHRRTIRFAARLVLALFIGWLWFKATRLTLLAIDLSTRANALKQEALSLTSSQDIPASLKRIRTDVDDFHAQVSDARATLWPFDSLLKASDGLPVVGHDLAALPHLLDMVDSILAAVHDLDLAYSPLLDEATGGAQSRGSILSLVTQGATLGGQALDDAKRHSDAAVNARRQIAETATLNPRLQAALGDADKLLDALNKVIAAGQAAPDLLGVDKPQHVLILIENADELRATGGFITASAYVVIDQGHLSKPVVIGSTSPLLDRTDKFQYETPPLPFARYMHLAVWMFRDSNWSPDFPTSAVKAAELYSAGMGVPVDTVVAVNQYTIRDLLGATGPITLADGSIIAQDDAIQALQDLWTRNLEEKGAAGRKDFIQALAPQMIAHLLDAGDAGTLIQLWRAQEASGLRHDLLIYSTDLPVQAFSERMGLDGSLLVGTQDYLYVVDTNIGWNKVDRVMQREMKVHVNLSDLAAPHTTFEMDYRNPEPGAFIGPACITGSYYPRTYPQRADDCYADYIRLYLPNGTQLVSSPKYDYPDSYVGLPDPKDAHFFALPGERNKAVFGALMVVATGKQLVNTFTYSLLPQDIFTATRDGHLVYRLTIPKQPGRLSFPVTVSVDLPAGIPAVNATPEPASRDGDTLAFALRADADIHIQIELPVGAQTIQQLGVSLPMDGQDVPQSPRVAPTNPPLPTALPGTATPAQ